ncbi:MAG: ABC transporter permease subunit [Limisphaerales bacterium]
MLPIARRELEVAARRSSTYWQRVMIGGCAVFIACIIAAFAEISPSYAGNTLFKVLSWAAFILCLLDGIRCSSDALASERREGTLGLLFLTDLRGHDIVLGKFSSAAVNAFTSVIVTLPIFAIPLLLGGVTAGESMRMMLTLIMAVLFSLAVGMLVSAMSSRTLAALGTTLLIVLTILFVPYLFHAIGDFSVLWLAGPFGMFVTTGDTAFDAQGATYWWALLVSAAGSLGMLAAAGFIITRPGSFDSKPVTNSWWKRLLEPKQQMRGDARTVEVRPAVWLANRTLPGRRILWFIVVLGILGCFGFTYASGRVNLIFVIVLQSIMCFLLKVWVAAVAPQSLHASRQSGAIELLLCTPLKTDEIVWGQIRSLCRYILPPALVIYLALPVAAISGAAISGDVVLRDEPWVMLWFGLFSGVIFLLDFAALVYLGLWFGLTSTKIEQAIAKTALWVLFVPYLVMIMPCVGIVGFLVCPVLYIAWAHARLFNRFAFEVTERSQVEQRGTVWWPFKD